MTVPAIAPKLSKREIKRISLRDFEARKQEITDQLMEAASDLGFFTIENTGISQSQVKLYTRGCPLRPPEPSSNMAFADRLHVCAWRGLLCFRRQSQVNHAL